MAIGRRGTRSEGSIATEKCPRYVDREIMRTTDVASLSTNPNARSHFAGSTLDARSYDTTVDGPWAANFMQRLMVVNRHREEYIRFGNITTIQSTIHSRMANQRT